MCIYLALLAIFWKWLLKHQSKHLYHQTEKFPNFKPISPELTLCWELLRYLLVRFPISLGLTRYLLSIDWHIKYGWYNNHGVQKKVFISICWRTEWHQNLTVLGIWCRRVIGNQWSRCLAWMVQAWSRYGPGMVQSWARYGLGMARYSPKLVQCSEQLLFKGKAPVPRSKVQV